MESGAAEVLSGSALAEESAAALRAIAEAVGPRRRAGGRLQGTRGDPGLLGPGRDRVGRDRLDRIADGQGRRPDDLLGVDGRLLGGIDRGRLRGELGGVRRGVRGDGEDVRAGGTVSSVAEDLARRAASLDELVATSGPPVRLSRAAVSVAERRRRAAWPRPAGAARRLLSRRRSA